jgi:DNA repair protein RAD16
VHACLSPMSWRILLACYKIGNNDDEDEEDANDDDDEDDGEKAEIDEQAYAHLGTRVASESNTGSGSPYFVKHVSFFMSVPWLRLILDESHRVRNRHTKAHIALLQLDCAYRWCVSGTPVSCLITLLGDDRPLLVAWRALCISHH